MNILNRMYKIQWLISKAGGQIETRKKLHKMVYLLQIIGEDFGQDYVYHNYGVFSPTLAYDLDFAKSNHLVDESFDENKGYTIKIGTPFGESSPHKLGVSNKSVALISQLARLRPQEIEVISTIVYLSRNYYSGNELKAKLRQLKPSLSKDYETGYRVARSSFGIQV